MTEDTRRDWQTYTRGREVINPERGKSCLQDVPAPPAQSLTAEERRRALRLVASPYANAPTPAAKGAVRPSKGSPWVRAVVTRGNARQGYVAAATPETLSPAWWLRRFPEHKVRLTHGQAWATKRQPEPVVLAEWDATGEPVPAVRVSTPIGALQADLQADGTYAIREGLLMELAEHMLAEAGPRAVGGAS